jgi:hypothetical protein
MPRLAQNHVKDIMPGVMTSLGRLMISPMCQLHDIDHQIQIGAETFEVESKIILILKALEK